MKKIFFSLGVFDKSDYRYNIFNNQIKKRNAEYCNKHNFEYLHLTEIELYRDHYSWSRLKFAKNLIDNLNDGDIVTNIDADMCIVDGKKSFETNKSFAYSIDTGNSHCLGSWTLKVNNWSRKLINDLLSDELYEKYKNDDFVKMWKEQAIFYYITGIKKPSANDRSHYICHNLNPTYGFNEFSHGETIYSLDELIENIEILPSSWNVSYQDGAFFICKNDQIIIKHWGGQQRWEPLYYDTPISL